MSAAFSLDYSGDPVPCDFPGCVLDAFHAGDHEFRSEAENNARLMGTANHYGVNTRSYNGSAQKREMDEQRKVTTAIYEAKPRAEFTAPLSCRCPQRDYPHELSVHSLIRSEWWKKELRGSWPWSLMASVREEPSTERRSE
jgi:hypothetical protein